MLPHRQRKLIELLRELGGESSNLDFQKLLFLYCQEFQDSEAPYQFIPYKFGGFSFTSYADKRRLVEKGVLKDVENRWVLNSPPSDKERPESSDRARIRIFAKKTAGLRNDELVAKAYQDFPFYAINSEIAERVLKNDRKYLSAIDATRPAPNRAGIATIGYEGLSLETYLNRLIRDGVTVLCDVRRNPLSRKYGFSKKTLQNGCNGIGVRYEHLPQLGISSAERKSLKTEEDYEALFARYRSESLPTQPEAVEKIKNWVKAGERVALTCFEAMPHQCHRHCVADELEKKFGAFFKPNHL